MNRESDQRLKHSAKLRRSYNIHLVDYDHLGGVVEHPLNKDVLFLERILSIQHTRDFGQKDPRTDDFNVGSSPHDDYLCKCVLCQATVQNVGELQGQAWSSWSTFSSSSYMALTPVFRGV